MDTALHLLKKFQSRLTAAIAPADLTIVVESVTGIPTTNFMAILDDSSATAECVWVTSVATVTKTLTVTRAQRGTTAVAHAKGVLLFHSEVDLADLGYFEVWETAGETGRPLESQLITDVLLGAYANGLKGYVDCNDSGGSIGLLSGVNGEIRLPDGAGRGAYYALEGEVVLQESSTITPWGSSAGFLYLGASGHETGLADFNADGVFMTIVGLTPLAGNILSLDYHTLKVNHVLAGAHLAKFLVMSIEENMISHSFSALAANGRLAKFIGDVAAPNQPDTQGFFEVTLTISGAAVSSGFAFSAKLAPGANCTLATGNHGAAILTVDQITNVAADISTANFCIARLSMLLDDVPASAVVFQMSFITTVQGIFGCNDPAACLGYVAGGGTGYASPVGTIPLACNPDGTAPLYVMVYGVRT